MNPKNQLRKRRKYDEDFKAEVLKMIENGQSISTVSQSLGIGENLIYRWKSKQKSKLKYNGLETHRLKPWLKPFEFAVEQH